MTAHTRVLHIDPDDSRAQAITRELVRRDDLELVRAQSHTEGIRLLLDEGPFDAVLVDIDPHHTREAEVIRDIDLHAPGAAIVATSSQPTPNLDQDCLRAGASDVLSHDHLCHHVLDRVIRHAIDRTHHVEQIRELSTTDDLTNIGNRHALQAWHRAAASRLERHGGQIVVAVLDVDAFKTVNDTFGHVHGDAILRDVAERLVAAFRPDDVAARLGGDEFALVVHCGDNGPRAISERVDQALHATPLVSNNRTVTVSAGYATTTTPDASLGTLLAEADEAMYRNKAARASPDR